MIYWLHDYRLKDWLGGAQLTTSIMLKNSPYKVKMMYPNQFDRNKLDGHLILISNCGLYKRSDLDWIINTQRYIKYERDVAFCKHRHAIGHDCRIECRDTLEFYTRMFQHSILNVFLSPRQARLYLHYMDLNEDKIFYSPSPVEIEKFEYSGPKEDLYLAVAGSGNEFIKGIDLIRKEYKDKNLLVLGSDKVVPYEKMPSWYKRARYFIAKPRVVEGFCRSAAEAFVAGCILITNGNVGFTEYKWPFDDKNYIIEQLRRSPERFWEKIGEYL